MAAPNLPLWGSVLTKAANGKAEDGTGVFVAAALRGRPVEIPVRGLDQPSIASALSVQAV